jgi:NADH:ubiquinone oxidoreductase subunit 5 (subunit L)/multisubunit Na+/H+ antiporter MnhA subunit
VKWSFDSFINFLFNSLKKLLASFSKTCYHIVSILFKFLYVLFSNTYKYIHLVLKPYSTRFVKYLYFFINFFLYVFISIPWWFLCEYLKPIKVLVYKYSGILLTKYPFILLNANLFLSFVRQCVGILVGFLRRTYNFFWKKFIDFVFFDLLRNKDHLNKKFYKIINIFTKFFLFYVFFYLNINNIIYNFFFQSFFESFVVWNRSTYIGIFNLILCYINLDNLFLLLYILFYNIGLSRIHESTWGEIYIYAGFNWISMYTSYKLDNPSFCFIKLFFDTLYDFLIDFNYYSLLEIYNKPLFFFFGCLFFTTVIVSWLFFSYLGLYGIFKLNIITLFLFWVSLLLSMRLIFVDQKVYVIKICNWAFLTLNTRVDYYFLIDTISFSFMLLTTTIAFFVFIYAFSYFRYEPLVDRFLLFLLSFVISMIFLVTSGNTIMLFLGWELIGLTSFFLINFWTTKVATLKSAFKAFTFNKVSDFFMFMFLVSSYSVFYSFDINVINNQVFKYESLTIYILNIPVNYLEFVAIMVIGASFIKSAQIGGHVWLPDSMEAPVPASALIHSATLVSAGVYMVLRFNFIIDCTQFSKFIIPLIGSLTAAYGGVCAVVQSDIKKTLAYSTISHCGFLMVLCSTEMNEFTILYLYVHGFFKAGVFMCVGNVLRITRGYQDTRRMGGLLKYLPFEYFCCTVGLLNLAGLPFTFGFFIKHLLLISLGTHMYLYYFVVFNSLVGAFAGLFYSYRLLTYTFTDFKKGQKILYINLNRSNYNSKFYTNSSVAATLAIFSLFVSSYLITYYMYKYILFSNFLFSDFMNTTTMTNYYSILVSFNGFLLNFSYINLTVITIIVSLLFSRYRKTIRIHIMFNSLLNSFIVCLFLYMFYMFI